jgi:hypothetical protein
MAENEFEKKVQQKMEELKLNPSDEVWKNVEVQIRKEKKRRWLLFLLLFLFIFFGGIFWWKKNHPTRDVLVKSNTDNVSVVINDKKEVTISGVKNENNDFVKLSQTETKISNDNYAAKQFVYIKKTRARFRSKQNMGENGENDGNEIIASSKAKMKVSIVAADANDSFNNNEVAQKNSNDSINITNTVFDSLKREQDKNMVINIDSNKKTNVEVTKNIDKAKDTSVNKNDNSKHKWDFAVQVGLGISATGNSYLVNNNATTSGAPATINNINPPGGYSQSIIKMSFAFKSGLSAIYHISKRLSVSAGVTYKMYSTVIKTGSPDSAVSFSYSAGNNNSYHNYYHFIDVSVEFQYRIGNDEQLPVYAFAGISLSGLIYTNALQFDYTKGIYYHDNSLFNKTGIGITGGFLFDMFQKKKISLQIGPDFYYGLSNMSTSGLYYDKHYSYIGLRFQKIIGKK